MTELELLSLKVEGGFISEELARLLNIITREHLSKSDLMEAVYTYEECRKVDTAYPQDYAEKMRELNPNFRGHFMVYDYNKHKFGAFENLAELVIMTINNEVKGI